MAALQERLARGEQTAFAELYDACADRVHHYLLVRLGTKEESVRAVEGGERPWTCSGIEGKRAAMNRRTLE